MRHVFPGYTVEFNVPGSGDSRYGSDNADKSVLFLVQTDLFSLEAFDRTLGTDHMAEGFNIITKTTYPGCMRFATF